MVFSSSVNPKPWLQDLLISKLKSDKYVPYELYGTIYMKTIATAICMRKLTTERLSLSGLITKLKISSWCFPSGCDIKEKKDLFCTSIIHFLGNTIRSGLWLNTTNKNLFLVLNWSLETERKREGKSEKEGASIC